jgi:hypothetical protein
MAKAKLNNYTPNTKLNNYGRACYTMAKAKLNNYTPNTKLNNYGRACYTMAKTSRPAMRSLTGINGLF